MRVLVTGAAGGLGRRVLPQLREAPALQLRALVHRTPIHQPGCETVNGALDDAASLLRAMRDVDTVLHLAAVTHTNVHGRYDAVNREGTRRVIESCTDAGVRRLVYVSSSAAHPHGGGYAVSKWEAERRIAESDLDWLILRPTEVYGAGIPEGINQLIRWVRRWPAIPVIGDGRYRVCPVALADVTEAILRSLTRADLSGSTLVLGGPEAMTFDGLIDRLSRFYGVRRRKLHLPLALVRSGIALAARVRPAAFARDQLPRLLTDKDYDIEPAARLLDYRPLALEAGLRLLGDELG